MKTFSLIIAGSLLLATAHMPSGFYFFLRILVTTGAVILIIRDLQVGFNFWVIIFGILAILFNPLIPVYLHDKSAWTVIDLFSSLMFGIRSFTGTTNNEQKP